MKNVLLLGDSIRMFYFDYVKSKLGDGYGVYAPAENCRFSSYALNSLRFWLSDFPDVDIIHWNIGLWDTAILYPEDGCFTPLDEYVRNMKRIQRELVKTGATVIFSTTTPVIDKKKFIKGPNPPAHDNQDIIRYNHAVLEALRGEQLIVNDLFSLLYPERDKCIRDDLIHPNEMGIQLLGDAIVDAIKRVRVVEKQDSTDFVRAARDEKTIQ